jgi:hypothetical protein
VSKLNVDEYIERYGPELGETFYHVHIRWCRLFTIFTQYSNLFGKSKERVALLNDTAGPFFKNVQDTFHDEILLGICRLTDPAQSKKKVNPNRNVSVLRLARLVSQIPAGIKIVTLADEAKNSANFARVHRDKKISHSDLEVATERSVLESGASILQMRHAIKAIHDVIFAIGQELGDVHMVASVIGSRAEFSLLKSLYESQQGESELRLRNRAEMGRDFNYKFYPDWLFDEDEETKWP